ncbi:MAG: NAD(P)-dependent oxidoreductase [Deltaproteobacteria bacterium]|nr:NAD(P)-dependent oxidoreductase [Deltaproteobacteria bacterium]
MRVLIVGINGFLGRAIAEECLMQRIIVEGVYHKHRISIPKGCRIFPLSNIGRIRDVYDVVFMVAAAIPYPGRSMSYTDLIKTNTQLPLQVALQFQKSFLVFASSVSVYGNSDVSRVTERTRTSNPNQYGITKLTAEVLLKRYHKKTAIIRFSSLYGKGMYPKTFIPGIIEDAKKKKIITLSGDGQRKQDYLHVQDAAKLCLKAAKSQRSGKYLGVSGTSNTNLAVAQYVCSHVPGCQIKHDGIDTASSCEYNASYTKKRLDFVPLISLEEGIEQML